MKKVFYGKIENNSLNLNALNMYVMALEDLNGKKIKLSLEEDREKRSNEQNNLYWMYLEKIGDETGFSKEDLHHYFRNKYLQKPGLLIPRSTTDLNTIEFVEYIRSIVVEMAEAGIELPSPEREL